MVEEPTFDRILTFGPSAATGLFCPLVTKLLTLGVAIIAFSLGKTLLALPLLTTAANTKGIIP